MAQTSGVLAIEFAPPVPARPIVLPTHEAALLLDAVANDLARLAPAATRCDLVAAGAFYDAAELLRPGWPIDAELSRLRQGLGARAAGRVTAFGAAGGSMPSPRLEPASDLAVGALRCLPWMIGGDPELVAAVSDDLERRLEDEGLAGAAVDLFLRQSLGVTVAHARYLTRLDLMALTALQLEHAGLGSAWVLIETALLAPDEAVAVELPAGGSLRFIDGRIQGRIGGFARHRVAAPDPATAAEAFARTLAFQRGAAALFRAHGLVSDWSLVDRGATSLVESAAAPTRLLPGVRLTRIDDPALGAVGLAMRPLAGGPIECHWPLDRDALAATLAGATQAAEAGQATLETTTLAEWASVVEA
jgi:hypothetical protein